jgi:Uma2 family endonuclease
MVTHTRITAEEFDHIATLPENLDKRLEFIGGEIVELVSDTYASEIAYTLGSEIKAFAKRNKLGRVTGADGGYYVGRDRYIPDVGFISFARQPERVRAAYNPLAPDLVVEVVSPTDIAKTTLEKVANYLAVGTVVWLVYPDEQEIQVFEPGSTVKTLSIDDTLEGGKVLPNFKLAVKDIFVD